MAAIASYIYVGGNYTMYVLCETNVCVIDHDHVCEHVVDAVCVFDMCMSVVT